jgi:hypothetical protein
MAVDPTASVRKLALKFAQLVGTGTRLPPRAVRFNGGNYSSGRPEIRKESTAQCYLLSVMMLTKGMQRRVSSVVVAKSPLDSLRRGEQRLLSTVMPDNLNCDNEDWEKDRAGIG